MEKLTLFKDALLRLSEALAVDPKHPLALDGSIQRFEFSFELCWKSIQEILFKQEGIEVKSPRHAFEQAYTLGWITDEALWTTMLKDRNLTSHTYDQPLAESIYLHLPRYHAAMESLLSNLEQHRHGPPRV
jgi:nucleotidyltransferase substrate binding protein (TIGR01987 family)